MVESVPISYWSEQLSLAARRLIDKKLLCHPHDRVSLRVPAAQCFLQINGGMAGRDVHASLVQRYDIPLRPIGGAVYGANASDMVVYQQRQDVCAVAHLSPPWGVLLPEFGGVLPPLFDEVVRHIGRSVSLVGQLDQLPCALAARNNAFVYGTQVICLGMTTARLVCNAELFEKSCKAFLLAAASGKKYYQIPFWVRWIAQQRLYKDQIQAAQAVAQGQMPAEAKGY